MGGLAPAIIQDVNTRNVLMLGFMNQEAYDKTIETGHVTFWSRTRQCLWTKGETSGNFLNFVSVMADCDNDTLLIRVQPEGPACHLGTDTCWGEKNTPMPTAEEKCCEEEEGEKNPLLFLSELQDFIEKREGGMPAGS